MHYLDYAATSAVRPSEVAVAVHRFLTEVGASPGRGGYALSVESGRMAFRCRRKLAQVLGVEGDPGRITFSFNATHALNTALHGILAPGDVVVTTPFNHNAVLRPVHALGRWGGVVNRRIPGGPDGSLDLHAAERLLEGARLLVVNAVSNVLGTALPLSSLAAMARAAGVLVLVDAAQSAGHLPASTLATEVDLVAFTGHKGLLGPQGTGGLWVRPGVDVRPFLTGGTGGRSEIPEMPEAYPDHLEAGTPNAPGIAGLLAGIEFLLARGVEEIHAHEAALKARLWAGMASIPGLRVVSPPAPEGAAVVTVVPDRLSPAEVAARLDREWSVCARPGLHCAPEVHRLLGTLESGALRFSLGWASTPEDVDRAIEGTAHILHSALPPQVPGGIPRGDFT
jgi:cysteine desulfurase / selenocysteine lyase